MYFFYEIVGFFFEIYNSGFDFEGSDRRWGKGVLFLFLDFVFCDCYFDYGYKFFVGDVLVVFRWEGC